MGRKAEEIIGVKAEESSVGCQKEIDQCCCISKAGGCE
jgi:hypothetical protein